jgi:hypothetical protein
MPPGYVPYGAMGTASWPSAARPGPLRTLGLVLTILLPLVALVAAGSAYVHLDRASLIDDSFGDGSFEMGFDRIRELDDAESRVDGFTGGYFLAVMVAGAVFIAWQHRHAVNAQALGERGGLGPPWAIGGWFVPLGSFVLPAIQLHQSSRLSDPSAPPGRYGRGRPIVLVWMVVWALSGIVLLIGTVSEPSGDDAVFADLEQLVDEQVSADRTYAAGAGLAVVAAALAVVMVRQLTDLQTRAIARAQATSPSAPPPPPRPPPPASAAWGPPPPAAPPPPLAPPPAPPVPPPPPPDGGLTPPS